MAVVDRDEWMRRLGPLYPGLIAVRAVSVIAPRSVAPTSEDLVRAVPWLPLAGGLLGAAGALAAAGMRSADVAPALAAVFALVVVVLLSGARRDRELSLVAAGLAGGGGGSGGETTAAGGGAAAVLPLVFAPGLRAVALMAIGTGSWFEALVLSQAISAWSALFVSRTGDALEPDLDGGLGSLSLGQPSWAVFGIASAVVGAAAIVLAGWVGVGAITVAAAVAFVAGILAHRREGGVRPETLGAIAALAEIAVLVLFAMSHPATISPWLGR